MEDTDVVRHRNLVLGLIAVRWDENIGGQYVDPPLVKNKYLESRQTSTVVSERYIGFYRDG